MAGFLRGKQAGIHNDLSAGIVSGLFSPDDRARFGINSQIGSVSLAPTTPKASANVQIGVLHTTPSSLF
jgi:hypothetical protein